MAMQRQTQWHEAKEDGAGAEWHDPRRRLEHQMEIQSHQIDQVLSRHQVPVGVSGGSVRSHWVRFDLAAQLSDGLDKLRRITGELTGEIASALGVPEVRLERQNGALRLAVKRNEPHPVDLLDLLDLLPEAGDLELPLGLNHQGLPVMLNLDQPDLHNILVAGISGAGKSSLMRSMAVALALTCRQSRAQLAVIGLGSEPSGITTRPNPLYPANYLPHLLFPVASEVDDAIEALAYLVDEVAYRADNGIKSPALIIMVDDADMLLRRVGGAVAEQLATLLHAPAEAGVQVIIGASNPGLPDLWKMLQHNVDLRLVGRVADERAAQVATDQEKSYAQYLDGKGDFIAVAAGGIEPFHAAYIDDYDLHLTLTELHRSSAPVLLAQTADDKPSFPPSWSAAGAQGFTYDPTSDRASLEPNDRGSLSTIEFAVHTVDEAHGQERRLSWLDDTQPDSYTAGLSLPLVADDGPEISMPEFEDDDVDQPPAAWSGWGRTAEDSSEFEPRAMNSQSVQMADATPPDDSREIVDEVAGDDGAIRSGQSSPDEEADPSYEMLPFDDGLPAQKPAEPANADDQSDGVEEELEDDPASLPSGRDGRGAIGPAREGSQKLWPLEPVYTDIDDDLWDAPEPDDEDWRSRLH